MNTLEHCWYHITEFLLQQKTNKQKPITVTRESLKPKRIFLRMGDSYSISVHKNTTKEWIIPWFGLPLVGSLAVEPINLALLMRFGDIIRTLLKYLTSWSNVLMLACSISLSFIPFMPEQESLLQRYKFFKILSKIFIPFNYNSVFYHYWEPTCPNKLLTCILFWSKFIFKCHADVYPLCNTFYLENASFTTKSQFIVEIMEYACLYY